MKSNLLPLDGKVSSTIAFAIRPRFLFMSVPWPAMLYLAEAFHLDSQTHLVAYLRQKCQDGVGMMLHGLGKMISLANHGVFRRPLVYIYVNINKFKYLNIYKYIYIYIYSPSMYELVLYYSYWYWKLWLPPDRNGECGHDPRGVTTKLLVHTHIVKTFLLAPSYIK